jgi:hypothetical protein
VELVILVSLRDLISLTSNWHFADLGELCFLKREVQAFLIAPERYQRWSVQA